MSRYHSWLNTANDIIRQYKGGQPLAAYLRTFFSSNKKYGSNDRRQISHLCYCYYRLGKLAENNPLSVRELIITGLFLCTTTENDHLLKVLKPEWASFLNQDTEAKLRSVNRFFGNLPVNFTTGQVFPWANLLSGEMNHESFCNSFFVQPDVFIRIRRGFEKQVRHKLQKAGIDFRDTGNNDCLAFNNLTKIEEVIALNKEAVVQDYNSQQVLSVSQHIFPSKMNVWDSCAASGGKSILAADLFGKISLTVSDIRPSILNNLQKRLAAAGVSIQQILQLDLTQNTGLSSLALSPFDLVICDAPCSGSGTWSRTPESLHFFKQEQIGYYQGLQQQIVMNAASQVKSGGYFFYITCSVFKMENEMIVDHIVKDDTLNLVEMKLLKGYHHKSDTMFTALFRKK
ncbi:MAG: Fmu (Sun) domain-containing protein [Chitinophagaceae bacterium]|nr:Fmu (Sun) domain-containing protein [Chitinophagaceae bacterium]